MKREEWEKTTGRKFVRERRKVRRDTTRRRVRHAYYKATSLLGLYVEQIEGKLNLDASARKSDNAALAAVVKFGRRFMPLYEAATRELDRRYQASAHGHEVERIAKAIDSAIDDSMGYRKVALTRQRRAELKCAWKRNHR